MENLTISFILAQNKNGWQVKQFNPIIFFLKQGIQRGVTGISKVNQQEKSQIYSYYLLLIRQNMILLPFSLIWTIIFYIQKHMQIAIKLLLTFILLHITQQNTPCFYTHFFTIFEGQSSVKTYTASGYQFPLTWAAAQNNILASSYVLMGFKIQNSYKELSYTSSLSSVTSSGATFNFNLHASRSQIVVAHFSVIISKTCGVEIHLKYISIVPYRINNRGRDDDDDDQTYDINVGFSFSDTKWKYAVMLSSFSLQLHDDRIDIALNLYSITVGNTYHRLKLTSQGQQHNGYYQIWITYILMKEPDLKKEDYLYSFSSTTSTSSLDSQSIFFPGALNKCVFGLNYIRTEDIDSSPTSINVVKTGSTTGPSLFTLSQQRITSVQYQIVCLGKCIQANKYPAYATNSYTCDICSAILTSCLTCNSSNYCLTCKEGYYSNPSANYTCTICVSPCTVCSSTTYCTNCTNSSFLSVTSPNQICINCLPECSTCSNTNSCLTCVAGTVTSGGCTDNPTCISVNNTIAYGSARCLQCILPTHIVIAGFCECNQGLGYKQASSLCTNVTGCDTASQVNNQTICQTCSTTLNYKSALQNGSCVCADGYFMIQPGFNQSCIACLPECATCLNSLSCLTCITGWVIDGGCTDNTLCLSVNNTIAFASDRCLLCIMPTHIAIAGICECNQALGYKQASSLCTNVTGCDTASLINNQTVCQTCSTTMNYKSALQNNSCVCAAGFFMIQPGFNQSCVACRPECSTCDNVTSCITCATGRLVQGGCTEQIGCIKVDSSLLFTDLRCLQCKSNQSYLLVAGKCECVIGYYLVDQLCTAVKGCATAVDILGQINCTSCDVSRFFVPIVRNGTCVCLDRLYLPTPPEQTTCFNCLADCELCSNASTCTKCIQGAPVDGGCTIDSGCIQVDKARDYSSNRCLACDPLSNFRLVSGTCICFQGFVQLNRVCTNVTGCLAAKRKNDTVVCVNCNVVFNFQTAPVNNQCLCKDGFELKNSVCVQICGDGKRFTYRCDDGNRISGDGCSPDCQIQTYFDCYGQKILPSTCIYIKYNIVVELVSINKVLFKNTGIFTFRLSPNLDIFDKLNISSIGFQTNRSHSIASIKRDSQLIILQVDFVQDLEQFPAKLRITLDRPLFLQKQAIIHFQMVSGGQKLIIISSEGNIQTLNSLFNALTLIAWAIFLLSLFSHKMIGIQLIHSFQIIFFVHLINSNYTPPFSILAQLANSGLNIVFKFNYNSNVQTPFQTLQYSSLNQEVSLYIIILTTYLPTIILSILLLIKKVQKYVKKQQQQAQSNHKIDNIIILVYNRLVFPFFMVDLLVFFLIIVTTSINQEESSSLHTALILILPLLSFVYFFQLESLLAKKRAFFSSLNGISNCKQQYIGAYLLIFFITVIMISIRYLLSSFLLEPSLGLLYLAFFLYIIKQRPYQRVFHNIGIIANLITTLIFLIWCNLRAFIEPIQAQGMEIVAVMVILGLLLLNCICSLIRIILEMKDQYKCSPTQSSGEEQSRAARGKKVKPLAPDINQKDIQSLQEQIADSNFLKYQREYLKKFQLTKNVLMMNRIPDIFFQKRKDSSSQLNQNGIGNLRKQFLKQQQYDHRRQ